MATVSKASLHSVLAKVEELALPEGEYLTLCSILKKQFETVSPDVLFEEAYDNTIVFTGKKVVTIVFTHRIVYKGNAVDTWRFSINGVAKELDARKCGELMASFYRTNLTKTITLNAEHEVTLQEYKKWMADACHDDEDEDEDQMSWRDYTDQYTMLHLAGLNR